MSRNRLPGRDLVPEEDNIDELYSPDYLRDCAGEEARQERLEELKRRIALRKYDVDADRIAEGLLSRGDLASD